MVNITDKRCLYNTCDKLPTFNYPTEKKRLYCDKHKLDGMINIKNKKCSQPTCNKIPNYNFDFEKKPLYCVAHKKEKMVDVKNSKCISNDCIKRPMYNLCGEKRPLYCLIHKSNNMINFVYKTCSQDTCDKKPYYNYLTETKTLYCIEHKLNGMIHITNKKCQFDKCKEIALYGLSNTKAHYCNNHKQPNMINLVLDSKCTQINCDKEYDFIVDNIKYCLEHHPNKDIEVILKKKCKYCDIEEKSNYTCNDCKKIQNKKEWSIVRYLRKNIDTPFEYNTSKMLQGCSQKRPDVYFELNKHCVIVEIDENQHKAYDDLCECSRINEIVNGIGGKSVIMIRYNPDKIKNNKKEIKIDQNIRLNILTKTIKEELVKDYDEFIVKIIQLYYDDNIKKYQECKEEIITHLVAV
jgi:hypothetical protein